MRKIYETYKYYKKQSTLKTGKIKYSFEISLIYNKVEFCK